MAQEERVEEAPPSPPPPPSLVSDSLEKALKAEQLIERIVASSDWNNAHDLMELLREEVRRADYRDRMNNIPVNIIKHILKMIRDMYRASLGTKEQMALHQYIQGPDTPTDFKTPIPDFRSKLLDHLTGFRGELESSADNIATQALAHIHNNEVIMVHGKSHTVEKFLKCAARERKFHVIVVEGSPPRYGHAMAAALADCDNIKTTLVPSTHIFALMSRVNKVIIGTCATMADGALRARVGVAPMAGIAQRFSVPVIVLTPSYKFTPFYLKYEDISPLNCYGSPLEILPQPDVPFLNRVNVCVPLYDHVTPDLITLLISQMGGYGTPYVYRLLSELYHPDDFVIAPYDDDDD